MKRLALPEFAARRFLFERRDEAIMTYKSYTASSSKTRRHYTQSTYPLQAFNDAEKAVYEFR